MDDRNGCLSGLLKIGLLAWAFDWLEDNFGFGRGCSITGCGCGVVILCVFLILLCSIVFGTNWTSFSF